MLRLKNNKKIINISLVLAIFAYMRGNGWCAEGMIEKDSIHMASTNHMTSTKKQRDFYHLYQTTIPKTKSKIVVFTTMHVLSLDKIISPEFIRSFLQQCSYAFFEQLPSTYPSQEVFEIPELFLTQEEKEQYPLWFDLLPQENQESIIDILKQFWGTNYPVSPNDYPPSFLKNLIIRIVESTKYSFDFMDFELQELLPQSCNQDILDTQEMIDYFFKKKLLLLMPSSEKKTQENESALNVLRNSLNTIMQYEPSDFKKKIKEIEEKYLAGEPIKKDEYLNPSPEYKNFLNELINRDEQWKEKYLKILNPLKDPMNPEPKTVFFAVGRVHLEKLLNTLKKEGLSDIVERYSNLEQRFLPNPLPHDSIEISYQDEKEKSNKQSPETVVILKTDSKDHDQKEQTQEIKNFQIEEQENVNKITLKIQKQSLQKNTVKNLSLEEKKSPARRSQRIREQEEKKQLEKEKRMKKLQKIRKR